MHTKKIWGGSIAGLLVALVILTSCEKTFDDKIATSTDLNKSYVQVFIATVNANRNVVMVDGKRVSRPTLTSGTCFPTAAYPSTNTAAAFVVDGGIHNFTIMDTLATTTQKPLNFATTMDASKMYTIFAYDTITNPKQVTVETPIEIPADGSARLRFANFIHDVNAVPAVEVYSRRRAEVIFANINKTDVTSFIPYSTTVTDTLDIRPAGGGSVLAQFTGFLPLAKRSYTLVYRGSHRGTKAATIFANY